MIHLFTTFGAILIKGDLSFLSSEAIVLTIKFEDALHLKFNYLTYLKKLLMKLRLHQITKLLTPSSWHMNLDKDRAKTRMNSIFLLSKEIIKSAHFNLWVDRAESFLDVGLILSKNQMVELYLPWKCDNPEDLFYKINRKDILNALFNQHLTVYDQTNNSQFVTIDLVEGGKLDVVQAHTQLEAIKSTSSIFTKVIISPKCNRDENDSYLRLRFKGSKANFFSKRRTRKDAWINPFDESIELIDFRINEVRSVPWDEFNTEIKNTPEISKMHFFLLKSYKENNVLASPYYSRCRQLEDKAWESYLPNHTANDGILAYHWTDKIEKDKHYSILASFSRKETSLRVIWYLIFIILIGALSCWAYDWSKFWIALPLPPSQSESLDFNLSCYGSNKLNSNLQVLDIASGTYPKLDLHGCKN